MGLNCGCPAGPHIPSLDIKDCKESLGQLQKVVFQRVYETPGLLNSVADPTKKSNWTPLFSASDGTKTVVSPYIENPTTEPGAARTFGGGNATLGGVERIIGREPTTFSGIMYEESQLTMAQMKQLMCENVGVWLIDENGNIGCLVDDHTTPTVYMPIPIGKLFIGDKKLGGFEEPDSNVIEWNFYPNWSDMLYIVKRDTLDFDPLSEFVNA